MNNLLERLPRIQNKKLMVVGDVGIDEYVVGSVRRISPEAPVPVVEVQDEDVRLGLSTNVAQNISGLGSEALLISVVGDDVHAEQLKTLLKEKGVSSDFLVVDKTRPTTRKLRVMAQHHHIVRVDYERKQFVSDPIAEKILKRVGELMPECDGVILQDYAKGVLSEATVQKIVGMAKSSGKKVMVDPYRSTPLKTYYGCDVMTPNYDEALQLAGFSVDDLRGLSDSLEEVGQALMKAVGTSQMVITRGKDGMSLFENGTSKRIPTFARQVFDVTGAGDTVIAALSLAWVAGLGLEEACLIANYAAGVVVGQVGCVPCTTEELISYIRANPKA